MLSGRINRKLGLRWNSQPVLESPVKCEATSNAVWVLREWREIASVKLQTR